MGTAKPPQSSPFQELGILGVWGFDSPCAKNSQEQRVESLEKDRQGVGTWVSAATGASAALWDERGGGGEVTGHPFASRRPEEESSGHG